MSLPNRPDPNRDDVSSQQAAVAAALRRATDLKGRAWSVLEAVRDPAGTLVDLRILYGNAGYWALSGLDPATAVGRGIAELIPGLDRTIGIAVRLFQAMNSGGNHVDRQVRFMPQGGPLAGRERVFELELSVLGETLAAGYRDITAEVEAADHQAAEARRSAALARFLAAAVDHAIDRAKLLDVLASELAATIGNLCVIIEPGADSTLQVVAVAGGPGDTAARIRSSHLGRPFPLLNNRLETSTGGETLFLAQIPADARQTLVDSMRRFGLPDDLASTVTSMIGVTIRSGDVPIGRLHVERFGDDPPYTREDLLTVEAIASAAALVIERTAIEDNLATSLARFEALFEQAPVPMVVVGSDRTVRLNRSATVLYGRDNDEMARLAFQQNASWIPGDQEAVWDEMRRQVSAGELVDGVRFALLRPDGERREVEGSSIPIVTLGGGRAGVVTVLTDLTDRLSLEAQLRHAQKMEALGRLAGGIAHDFNNVLMAILGYAQLVARDSEAGQPVEPAYVEQVIAATRRAIELTARLTTFARRDTPHTETVEVGEMVTAVMPLITRLAPESIEIVTHLEPGLKVTLDRGEFEQVLVNLIVNAADAMPHGGRLTIESEMVEIDADRASSHLNEIVGRYVLVAVSDTGIGMDDATQSRIFEPFFTTKAVGEGTGLGLSMAFAAVERAKGRIWVYSEPGHGTTVKIYLPASGPGESLPIGSPDTVSAVEGGSESILLLEDDQLVRDLLLTVLRDLGYDVTVASIPSEAFAAAAERRFDLLVSDVVMPEMMGNAAAARLREAQPELRVVFMSGYTERALDFTLGPRDLLVHKPVGTGDIARAVRHALDR